LIKATVTYVKPRATLVYVKAAVAASSVEQKFLVQFQDINTVVSYIKAVAVDVALNPSSLNQWFRDETFSVTDGTPTLTFNKNATDSFTVTEVLISTASFPRSVSDAFSVSESLQALLTFERSASDSFNNTDSLNWSFNGSYADSFTVTDAITYSLAVDPVDSFTITDSTPTFDIALTQGALADAFTTSESFARTGVFIRSVSDSVTVSENISTQFIPGISAQFNRPVFNTAQFNH
tara:strand:- start:45 stop:752 length:708 start_codon:yes stop_codon:yes gene_type:complete